MLEWVEKCLEVNIAIGLLTHAFYFSKVFSSTLSLSSSMQVPEMAIFFIEDGKKVPAAWSDAENQIEDT